MIVPLVVRAFQLIFAAVVLGLSVTLIKHQQEGSAPATTGYSAFSGGWGLIAAAIGIAAIFVEAIPAVAMMAIDGLSSLIFVAGGVALTVALKGVQCKADAEHSYNMARNKILNGGVCRREDSGSERITCRFNNDDDSEQDVANTLKGRCMKAQADYVFLYLGFALFLGAVGMTFFIKRRGGHRRGMVV